MSTPTVIRTYERDGIRVDVVREPDDRNRIVYYDISWASAKPSRRRSNGTTDWSFVVDMARKKADRDFRVRQTAIAGWA